MLSMPYRPIRIPKKLAKRCRRLDKQHQDSFLFRFGLHTSRTKTSPRDSSSTLSIQRYLATIYRMAAQALPASCVERRPFQRLPRNYPPNSIWTLQFCFHPHRMRHPFPSKWKWSFIVACFWFVLLDGLLFPAAGCFNGLLMKFLLYVRTICTYVRLSRREGKYAYLALLLCPHLFLVIYFASNLQKSEIFKLLSFVLLLLFHDYGKGCMVLSLTYR